METNRDRGRSVVGFHSHVVRRWAAGMVAKHVVDGHTRTSGPGRCVEHNDSSGTVATSSAVRAEIARHWLFPPTGDGDGAFGVTDYFAQSAVLWTVAEESSVVVLLLPRMGWDGEGDL